MLDGLKEVNMNYIEQNFEEHIKKNSLNKLRIDRRILCDLSIMERHCS